MVRNNVLSKSKEARYGYVLKNIIRDACTPQPWEIVFNTMSNRSTERVQRSGYFQSNVSKIKAQIMFKLIK